MAILITGGAGYIGSHTVRLLQEKGFDVVVYDNLIKGHKDSVKNCPLIIGDIFDKEQLGDTLDKYSIDSVIHFAAFSLVGESMENPNIYYNNNVAGTLSLLNTMLEHGVNKIVFSSTAAVYGNPDIVPITESSEKKCASVYARSKWMIEQIMEDFDSAYGMKYIALRYFNAAGAHIDGNIGEDHNPESHLIPNIMRVVNGKSEFLNLFGTDYPTEDGTCVRDYIHITDLAQAHLLAVDALRKGAKSNQYNLGNGNGFSNLQVVRTVEKISGKHIPIKEMPRRAGDPAILVASSQKIISELGWKPQYNNLETIIETAYKWHLNYPNGFNDK